MTNETKPENVKTAIGDRAAWIAGRLADTSEKQGLSRPELTRVGNWELRAIPADEDTLRTAEHARADVESIAAPGRGAEYWKARPGLIKFASLRSLAAAYRFTGDDGYARAFRTLVEDFWASLEPPKWAGGCMRPSSRIGNWVQYMPYFFDSPHFDDSFINRMLDSIGVQLDSILANQKIGNRGNIRLLETNGIFWCGLGLPMLDQSQACLKRARWVYADAARHDLNPDGSHVEHDPNYHEIYQATFFNLMIWRDAFPEAELPDVTAAALRVFDYAVATRRPNGHCCGIQESSSAWVGGGDITPFLKKRAQVRRLAGLPDEPPPLTLHCQDAGQVFMRDGWDRNDTYLVFDASRWGGAHSHLARNGVQLFARGRALLADTGTLTYAMGHKGHEGDELDHQIGPYGKSTRAHNTLNLNGWNQAPTNPDGLRVFDSDAVSAVVSRYSGGYWPGTYDWWFRDGFGAGVHAEHQRILIWVKSRFAVVVDRMMRWDETALGGPEQQNPSLEMNWQLTPGGSVELHPANAGFTAVYPEGGLLGLFPKIAQGMRLSVREGETEPLRGWITTRLKARSDLRRAGVFNQPPLSEWVNRSYGPAPQICAVADPMQGFGEALVSVFVPFDGDTAPELVATVGGEVNSEFAQRTGGQLELRWPDGKTDSLHWTSSLAQPLFRTMDTHGDYETDGALLHLHREADGTLNKSTVLDGTYCTLDRDIGDAQ